MGYVFWDHGRLSETMHSDKEPLREGRMIFYEGLPENQTTHNTGGVPLQGRAVDRDKRNDDS